MKKEYQVFISFKQSNDETGEDTLDKGIAFKVYQYLSSKDLKVFLSSITLKSLGQDNWSDEINLALKESKVFIAIGTNKAHMNSQWVYTERVSFFALKLVDNSKAIYGYIASPMLIEDLPDDMKQIEVFQDKKPDALKSLYTYIRNHLLRSFRNTSNKVSLIELRKQFTTTKSIYELKKLLYEVEYYQSQYPNCIDTNSLMDLINKKILNIQQKYSKSIFNREYNLKKIIYLISSMSVLVLLGYIILNIKDNEIKRNLENKSVEFEIPKKIKSVENKNVQFDILRNSNKSNLLELRIETIPSDAQISISDSSYYYNNYYYMNNMYIVKLSKGIYKVEVFKEGYKTKVFEFELGEDDKFEIPLKKDDAISYPRIVHIQQYKGSFNQKSMNGFQQILKKSNFKTFGVEKIRKFTFNNSIKYFTQEDFGDASKLLKITKDYFKQRGCLLDIELLNVTSSSKEHPPLEVWINDTCL